MPKSLGTELTALKTVKSFNDLAQRAADKASDSLTLAWKAGELAQEAKATMKHGEWVKFVGRHYVVGHSTVTRWMQFHANVPESKLCTVHNLAAGIKMLEPPKKRKKRKSKPPGAGSGTSGGDSTDSTTEAPEVAVTIADEPGTGKCPNCGKLKWDEDEDGFSCKACMHPWGEPAGDPDVKPFKLQKKATVSYLDYAQRAVNDLNDLKSNPKRDEIIKHIQAALKIVKEWKQ